MLEIRELLRYLKQGESERAISRALGLSRNTIKKYREWLQGEGLLAGPLPSPAELQARLAATQTPAPVQTQSSVEPYRKVVEELRGRGVEVAAIYQRLREQGYRGQYSAVYRFVRRLEPQVPDATVRVETSPGEEAQVDFGYAGWMYDPQQQKVRKAWAFVMTLSWSRHQYVEFVFDQRVETWLQLHRHAFEFFGGAPYRIVLDNLKAGIVKASWDDPQVQRAYRECAEHYLFVLAPCKVAHPQHKGKVESGGVHYVKRNFLAGRSYSDAQHDIARANREVRDWAYDVAGLRRHGTTHERPWDRFTQAEHGALLPLPPEPFENVVWKQVKLHRDCHIVFDNAYYSAPQRLIGQTLWVRGTATTVKLYADFELVATHTRACQPGQRQTTLAHLPPHKVAGLTLTRAACQTRAEQIGEQTARAVERLLAERPVDRLRGVHRLLNAAEREGGAHLEQACAQALACEDVSLRTIGNLFKQSAQAQPGAQSSARFARSPQELMSGLSGGAVWNSAAR